MKILISLFLSAVIAGIIFGLVVLPLFPSLSEGGNKSIAKIIFFVIYAPFLFVFTVIFTRKK
jgi:multisubunit Na+/H+ antiporter MnhE subunit